MEQKQETSPSAPEFLGIGDMARRYGVSARALRFYEQRGLLQPLRVGSGRFYESHQGGRLAQILRGKQLGFTLKEIRDMLDEDSLALGRTQATEQLKHLEKQRAEIDTAISALQAVLAVADNLDSGARAEA